MYIHLTDRKQSIPCLLATTFLVLCMLLIATTQADAEDSTMTTEPPVNTSLTQNARAGRENVQTQVRQKKQTIQENRDERRIERASTTQVRKENHKARLTDAAKARIRAHAERMWGRFTAAILRLKQLDSRIDSRIVKFEQGGVNLSEARELLELARTDITSANTALQQAKTAVETALSAEDPKLAFLEAQNLISAVRQKIVSAHSSLVQAVRSIRAGNPNTDTHATTTNKNE